MIKNCLIPRVFAAITALALGVLTVGVSSCVKVQEIAVKSVSVSPQTLTLDEGETATISYTLSPENATNKTVVFLSANEAVATVTESGFVTAVAAGSTKITVTSVDGPSASVSVTVNEQVKTVAVTGVTVDPTEVKLVEGETATLTATVAPENATDKSISWSSSDDKVVTVADGVVTAVAPGEATVTVKTKDGEKTATCKVTVEKKVIAVSGVTVDPTEVTLIEGDSATLTATVAPEDATDKSVTWSTSNDKVATVADGVVKAVAAGEATITVKTNDGDKTATCKVTVQQKVVNVTGVSVSPKSLNLAEGESATLTATVSPEDATDKSVTWSTSDEKVATVADGVVKAVAAGEAVITVETKDGGKSATCIVTVEKKVVAVTGVTVDPESVTITAGQTATLTATVSPDNATDKSVTWLTSNDKIATVADGVVTAIAAGEATITVKTTDGAKTATCKVTVVKPAVPVTKVDIEETSVEVATGKTVQLHIKVEPADATDPSIEWFSTNEAVATVDQNGVVTGVSVGKAIINAKNKASGESDSCVADVFQGDVEITAIAENPKPFYLGYDCSHYITPGKDFTVTPSNATFMKPNDFEYVSSNSKVVEIRTEGSDVKAYGASVGTATISGKPVDATTITSNQKMRVFNVFKPKAQVIEVLSSGFLKVGDSFEENNTVNMLVGERVKFAIYNGSSRLTPETPSSIGSSSYNSSIVDAEAHSNGTVAWTEIVAKKAGSAGVAIVLQGDDAFAAVIVTVNVGSSTTIASGDYISTSSSYKSNSSSKPDSLAVDAKKTLYLFSSSGSNLNTSSGPSLNWKSSNTSVVSIVSNSGASCQIQGVGKGTATITASDYKGNTRQYYVTVFAPVTEIYGLSSKSLSLGQGCRYTMRPGVDYEVNYGAEARRADEFYWQSANNGYVQVDYYNGEIVAVDNNSNENASVDIKAKPKKDTANIGYVKVRSIKTVKTWYLYTVESTNTSSNADTKGRLKNCAPSESPKIVVDKNQYSSYQYLIKEGYLTAYRYTASFKDSSIASAEVRTINGENVLRITGKKTGTTTMTITYHDTDYFFEREISVQVL